MMKELRNFAFEHEGETFWYSRSLTTIGYIFGLSEKDGWCILANKRGPGCPSNMGKWNVPCGYLEHGVNVVENCCKEIKEETGVLISPNELHFAFITSEPEGRKQNVNMSFYGFAHDDIENITLTDQFSEPDEVSEIKWIPIQDLDKYEFAFGQKKRIKLIFKTYVNGGIWQMLMVKLCNWLHQKYMIPVLIK